MRQEFPDPPSYVAIDWITKKPGAAVLRFGDRDGGIRFLQRISAGLGLLRLRRLWQDRPGGGGPAKVNDKQLLEQLADRLVKGDLQAFRIEQPLGGNAGSGGGGGAARGPDPALSGNRVETPMRLRSAPDPVIPNLPQEIPMVPDIDAQIDTLLAAARDGIPFCEQCAKDLL